MAEKSQTAILIIDDEQAIRQSFSDHLEDAGYTTFKAADGSAGIQLFQKEQVDLVLVDLRMPGINGLQVLSEIRTESPDTPLIVASGTGDIKDVIEALRKGAWDYLLKPIKDFSVLDHAVENALEKARLRHENKQYQHRLEQLVEERTKKLKKANDELFRNEKQLRAILDHMQTGIVIVDTATRRIVYSNPTADRMAGISEGDLLHRRCNDTICPYRDGRCPVLDHGEPIESSERLLKTTNGSEGKFVPIIKTVSHMRYGGKDCLLESFIDISAQKLAESEKAALEDQLRQAQKMEALGTLAGGIAHDFNNILGAILGYTELCFFDVDDPNHPLRQKLESIQHAGNRAKELVSQILAFSRMQDHVFIPASIAPIVKDTLKLLKASLPANIELMERIDSKQCVMADPTQIHQVIMNLCTNAYHAMEKQGGELTVSLKAVHLDEKQAIPHNDAVPGDYLDLCVEDTGTGISPSVIDSIFDPYFTTKDKNKGTGLGLAVVHGIIKSHGGTISVKSKLGEGTAIHVLLPITDDDKTEDKGTTKVLPRGTEKVLFVDDEKDLVDIGCKMLENLGYDVTGVVGSLKALETFKARPEFFDLIITDFNMPTLTGDRLAQEFFSFRPDLPIILCSGFSERLAPQKANALGVRKMLMKPLAMNILAETVRMVLDES